MTNGLVEVREFSLGDNWGWFIALGIVFLLVGAFGILLPIYSTLALTALVAVAFVFLGIVQIVQAFRMRWSAGFVFALAVGILVLAAGIAIWMEPALGAIALTFIVAAAFLAKGIAQIMLGLRFRPHEAWGWIVASGGVALLVGLMILLQWPASGLVALGILAGVSLMFTGWGYVALGLAARRLSA